MCKIQKRTVTEPTNLSLSRKPMLQAARKADFTPCIVILFCMWLAQAKPTHVATNRTSSRAKKQESAGHFCGPRDCRFDHLACEHQRKPLALPISNKEVERHNIIYSYQFSLLWPASTQRQLDDQSLHLPTSSRAESP